MITSLKDARQVCHVVAMGCRRDGTSLAELCRHQHCGSSQRLIIAERERENATPRVDCYLLPSEAETDINRMVRQGWRGVRVRKVVMQAFS